MKQSKVRRMQNIALQNTLARVNESTCPILFSILKEIVRVNEIKEER